MTKLLTTTTMLLSGMAFFPKPSSAIEKKVNWEPAPGVKFEGVLKGRNNGVDVRARLRLAGTRVASIKGFLKRDRKGVYYSVFQVKDQTASGWKVVISLTPGKGRATLRYRAEISINGRRVYFPGPSHRRIFSTKISWGGGRSHGSRPRMEPIPGRKSVVISNRTRSPIIYTFLHPNGKQIRQRLLPGKALRHNYILYRRVTGSRRSIVSAQVRFDSSFQRGTQIRHQSLRANGKYQFQQRGQSILLTSANYASARY